MLAHRRLRQPDSSSFRALLGVAVLPFMLGAVLSSAQTNTSDTTDRDAAERDACIQNLKAIGQAISAYERAHTNLPNWLSDLVPQYLADVKVLTCPVARRTGRTEDAKLRDPKMASSYLFEFCPVPLGGDAPGAPEQTRREWKRRQQELVGLKVPVVRCRNHKMALNLARDGTIYESPGMWEMAFTNKVSLNALSAASLFGSSAKAKAPPPAEAPPKKLEVPPRDAGAPKQLLDLSSVYNALLTNSWHGGKDNDLSALAAGIQNFGGVQFDVRGIVQLANKSATPSMFPTKVTGIPVQQRCAKLHFLHSAGWGAVSDEGKQIGSYLVRFKGNPTRLEIPIEYGREVRDWHWQPNEPPARKELKVVWTGENGVSRRAGRPLRLFLTTWMNLLPELEIESIDFVSTQNGAGPFLLAISAE